MKTSQSPDPAGLFSEELIPLVTPNPHNSTPAVDNHQYPVLHNLHTANNCNNCGHMITGKCEVHGYQMPFKEIDCEQWEYRGKKA